MNYVTSSVNALVLGAAVSALYSVAATTPIGPTLGVFVIHAIAINTLIELGKTFLKPEKNSLKEVTLIGACICLGTSIALIIGISLGIFGMIAAVSALTAIGCVSTALIAVNINPKLWGKFIQIKTDTYKNIKEKLSC